MIDGGMIMYTGTILMLIFILIVIFGGTGYLMMLNIKSKENKANDEDEEA